MKAISYKKYFFRGVAFLKEHPQIWFTALVGFLILFSFVFIAYRFASIAQDSQEELINVRIGSILDAFAEFAPDLLSEPDTLRAHMRAIQRQNPTIQDFFILIPEWDGTWQQHITISGKGEGELTPFTHIIFEIAQGDVTNAYTTPIELDSDRYFLTARALRDRSGEFVALAVTTQSLSEADQAITTRIRESVGILVIVVVVILILFLRHARLIDYASLYKKQLEVDEMKDSFISMASHELKSPLTVIRGYIEYLKESIDDEKLKQEYLRRIDLSATELRQLVDDILDVSRIEMGRLRFTPDHVLPEEVLFEVRDMFLDAAHTKNLTLTCTITEDARGAKIRVDRGRLKQVIVNLVSNALKYTLAGEIHIEQSIVDGFVEVSVRDTGVGMTSDEQKRLFDKFYRVEAKETKGVSGTGLGLWITKYIVEHMQGTITVESIKGDGSRFVVRFPAHNDSA